MTNIQRIVDSIPADVLLEAMTAEIDCWSPRRCLVCRLLSPTEDYDYLGTESSPAFVQAAKELGLPVVDMRALYFAADMHTGWVEEAIADRLNRLVSA